MPSWKIDYPPPGKGYWDPITSTIDWCEENYTITYYSAEIVNTLTNLLFIGLGIRGIRNCLKYGHGSEFIVAFAGYLLVGSGSFAFHSTLKYPMQLVDELSMIYTASLMCYVTFSFSRSRKFRTILGIGLTALAIFITLFYHFRGSPVFHQVAFGLITACILFKAMYTMETNIRPYWRDKGYATHPLLEGADDRSRAEVRANDARDLRIIREMWKMVAFGLSVFLGGFALWGIDRKFCSTFIHWRREIGLPWGILLEGHGWWHIMTGIGSYYYIVWIIWLQKCLKGEQDTFMLSWTHYWNIPEVVPIPEKEVRSAYEGYGTIRSRREDSTESEDRKSV